MHNQYLGFYEGFWEVRKLLEYQGVMYADCIFCITVHPQLKKIINLDMNLPQNTPPNLTPILSKNDAIAAAKTVLLDANYYNVTLPEQLLLYEEPELKILDKPWIIVGVNSDNAEKSEGSLYIAPTISRDAPELQQGRLYWDIQLYPNSEVSSLVVRFLIDASDGHYAGLKGTFVYGDLDPNIPIVTFPDD